MSKEVLQDALELLAVATFTSPELQAKRTNAINAALQTLAEQPAQQEPVGCEGAIVNGRVYADRLEHDYKFECEAGPLHLCTDWVEFRRCFEWLAQHTSPPAQRTWVNATTWRGLTDEEIDGMVEVTDLSGAYYYDDLHAVARATEAKLREKNT